MRAESIRSQLEFMQIKCQSGHFGPRLPVYDYAIYGNYFARIFNDDIDVSVCNKTEDITHLNRLPANTRYKEFSVDRFHASCRWEV